MKQTFKYRANPTRLQEPWIFAEMKHQKQLQNYMLQMRHQMWEYGRKSVSMYDQINHLKKLRASTSHYSDHPQDMQVSTIKRVNAAHEHFQRRCKAGVEKKVTLAISVLFARCLGLCVNTNLRRVNASVRIRFVKQALGITD